METEKLNTQENSPIVKMIPHTAVVILLIHLIVTGNPMIMIMTLIWCGMGVMIHYDVFIVPRIFVFIMTCWVSYQFFLSKIYMLTLLYWLISLWEGAFSFIEKEESIILLYF